MEGSYTLQLQCPFCNKVSTVTVYINPDLWRLADVHRFCPHLYATFYVGKERCPGEPWEEAAHFQWSKNLLPGFDREGQQYIEPAEEKKNEKDPRGKGT